MCTGIQGNSFIFKRNKGSSVDAQEDQNSVNNSRSTYRHTDLWFFPRLLGRYFTFIFKVYLKKLKHQQKCQQST